MYFVLIRYTKCTALCKCCYVFKTLKKTLIKSGHCFQQNKIYNRFIKYLYFRRGSVIEEIFYFISWLVFGVWSINIIILEYNCKKYIFSFPKTNIIPSKSFWSSFRRRISTQRHENRNQTIQKVLWCSQDWFICQSSKGLSKMNKEVGLYIVVQAVINYKTITYKIKLDLFCVPFSSSVVELLFWRCI